jgi:methionyl-tRNA formyltransferase
LKVVFVGASKFGLRCLELLSNLEDCEIVGAISSPQSFSISYNPNGVNNILHADVPCFCENKEIPCIEIKKGMLQLYLLEQVEEWAPDFYIVVGWYHMIPKSWRKLAPAYGMHASLLPDYSGGAPLVWSIINGETRTGITLFQLDDGVDDGSIIGASETEIYDTDDIASLYERVEDLGLELLKEYIPKLVNSSAVFSKQNEKLRRIFPQRSPEDGVINWNWSAKNIWNFVRAQTAPYPGAFTLLKGEKIHIWSGRQVSTSNLGSIKVGCIELIDESALVRCCDNSYLIKQASFRGNKLSGYELIKLIGTGVELGV